MKKIVNLFAAVAAVVMPLVSCQKEMSSSAENTIHITVVADGSDLKDAPTKTYVAETLTGAPEVRWDQNDNITLWEFVDGVYSQKKNSDGSELTENFTIAEFNVPLSDAASGSEFVYTAIHPADAVTEGGTTDKFYRFAIPANQQVVLNSETPNIGNMDSAADVLIGKPVVRTARPTDDEKLAFQFKRPGTIGKVTISGVPAGEKFKSVQIVAPATLTGYCKVDLKTGEVSDPYANTGSTITINIPCEPEKYMESMEGISYDFYFRCLSGTWTKDANLSVILTTDKAIYKKNATLPEDYIFDEGGLTMFKLNMANNTTREEVVDYTGNYVLVSGTNVMAGLNASTTYYDRVTASGATLVDLYEVSGIENYVWTVTKTDNGYSLCNAAGKYLALKTDGNVANQVDALDDSGKTTYFDLAPDSEAAGSIVLTSKAYPARTLRYNSANPRFAFYTSGQSPVQFVAWAPDQRTPFNAPSDVAFNSVGKAVTWTVAEGATNGYEYTLDNGATVVSVDTNTIDCSEWTNGEYSLSVRVKGTSEKKASPWSEVCEFTISGNAEVWSYTVLKTSPTLCEGSPVTVNEATWSIVMGAKNGEPGANGTPASYNVYGWKWGDTGTKYWSSYTLSTDYFTSKKVKSVTVNLLNNGSKSATMLVKQGSTTIGSVTKTFGQVWTDLKAESAEGTGGTLTIQYTVAQASYIHSITVEYYN